MVVVGVAVVVAVGVAVVVGVGMKTYAIRSALLSLAVNAAFVWAVAYSLGWRM